MSPDNWSPQHYAWEELISFARLKRAVSARVVKRLEAMMETEPIVDPEVIGGLTREEWQRAKEGVRSSPAAREAYKRFVEAEVGKQVTEFLTKDRAELETLGVAEKAL